MRGIVLMDQLFGWNLGNYAIDGAHAPRPVYFDRPDRMGVRCDGEFVFHKDDAGIYQFLGTHGWGPLATPSRLPSHLNRKVEGYIGVRSEESQLDAKAKALRSCGNNICETLLGSGKWAKFSPTTGCLRLDPIREWRLYSVHPIDQDQSPCQSSRLCTAVELTS